MINLISYNINYGDRSIQNRSDEIIFHYNSDFENETKVRVYLGDYIFNTEGQYQILNLGKGRYWSRFSSAGAHEINNNGQVTPSFIEPLKLVFIDESSGIVIEEFKIDIKFVDISLRSTDLKKRNAWIIGDPHIGYLCAGIGYDELEYDSIRINPISKIGLTMSRFTNSDYIEFISCLPIKDDDMLIFNLGEIDMRISIHVKSHNKGIRKKDILTNILLRYIQSIKEIGRKYHRNKILILRPNLPIGDTFDYTDQIIQDYFKYSNPKDRLELNDHFNDLIKSFCAGIENIAYVDNSSQYGTNGFISDDLLIENDIHMKPNKGYFDSLYERIKNL